MFNKNKIKELEERIELWMNNYEKCNERRLELREENIRLQQVIHDLKIEIEKLEKKIPKKKKTTKKKEVKKDEK